MNFVKLITIPFYTRQLHVTPLYCALFINLHFFKEFTKLNKFGIIGELLPSGASLYTFSLKRKKNEFGKGDNKFPFSPLYLKGLRSGFLVTKIFSSFLLRVYNFCFKTEIISRAFNARLGMFGTIFMFVKMRLF